MPFCLFFVSSVFIPPDAPEEPPSFPCACNGRHADCRFGHRCGYYHCDGHNCFPVYYCWHCCCLMVSIAVAMDISIVFSIVVLVAISVAIFIIWPVLFAFIGILGNLVLRSSNTHLSKECCHDLLRILVSSGGR